MKKNLYLLILSFTFLPFFLQAQQPAKATDTTVHQLNQVNKLNQINVISKRKIRIKTDTLSNTLKLQLPLIQVPQNIISISTDLLQQQGALELKDAARNSSGIYFGYNSTPFDNSAAAQIRGFVAYTTLNGMSRRFSYGASIDDDAIIENVEFVKGPAGFLNSVGEPGGSINILTKTPGHQLINIVQTAGSFNLYRISADIGSEVQKKGFSFRFNTAYQHKDTYLNDLRTEKYVVAPVLQYNFSPNTYVLAEYDFIKGEVQNGSAIVKVRSEQDILTGPISANYSSARGLPTSYTQNETGRIYAIHKFNDKWQITSQSSYLSSPYQNWNMTSKGSMVNFDASGNTKRRSSLSMGAGQTFSSQLFANGQVYTGAVKHQLLFGADYTNSRDSLSLNNGKVEFDYNKFTANSYVNPNTVNQITRINRTNNNTFLKSAFIYDNIQLQKKLLLTLGARYTWYTNEKETTNAKGVVKTNNYSQKALSPRAALTYMVNPATSVFFLYDQSFVPQSYQVALVDPVTKELIGSAPINPQQGKDMELGIKRNWFSSRLLTTLNAFHTTKTNVPIPDLVNTAFVKPAGQVTSNGIEADVIGNITDRLSITANYTYVKATITKDEDPEQVGKELPQTPQQIFNTWIQYRFLLKNKASLNISAGQTSMMKRSTSEKNQYIPDFTKFDAGISYVQDKYFFRLIADNLTGKRYMSSGDIITGYPYDGRNFYYIDGDPFNVKVSVGIKF
ncbi:iron complex outermembrane receptor protein [Pedobacter cryoconitis]|uniref:Iron complex outermembrane receptor protein n=1 Tax=Pedobacter cryoconitis TaxID=188932 RepID=A0A7W8ZR87_9SPHI|nr:TonB-dependent receptor [Pedobacter cryoconitis]MBB5638550.1 iron complex outermembrane receptor protein [Pedobacter cryoconitis]